jgi:hypothetical protein
MRRVADGQRPLPFKTGLSPKRKGAPRTWRLADGSIARVCPQCGCHRDRRCTILLDDDGVAFDVFDDDPEVKGYF